MPKELKEHAKNITRLHNFHSKNIDKKGILKTQD